MRPPLLVLTRHLPATDTRGSRIRVEVADPHPRATGAPLSQSWTRPYPHEARDAHRAALEAVIAAHSETFGTPAIAGPADVPGRAGKAWWLTWPGSAPPVSRGPLSTFAFADGVSHDD